jgi:hypothetical protein
VDRLSEWINQAVRKAVAWLPYAGHYDYSVVACNKLTQTISARSLSPAMPDLVEVGFASPGLALELPPGSQVRIGFSNMDPTKPYVASYAAGGIPPVIPMTGSGVLNEIDAGYVLITQTPAFVIAAVYFPAGVAGAIAANAAALVATNAGFTVFLLHMSGGRVLPDAWTVP